MHITRYTDYAVRVLVYLALEDDRLVPVREIADGYDISRNHLMKLVGELSRAGYVETVRGKSGGLKLCLRPEEINIGVLVREVEPDFRLAECFGPDNQCHISPACLFRKALGEALEKFLGALDNYTLADLMSERQQPQLIRLLGLT
ncbi:RrF2 family transcriptional regulator [Marinobacter sp.]|uniref:RrF2 family transcriptional regulator n=1 Tax=Marinobacter sp. TaxID=50741 RepID=UPI00384DA05B